MKRDIQGYVRSGSAEQRRLFSRLERMVLDLYPRAAIGLAYGVPTYGTKPGRVGLGYWKEGVSFYPYSGSALDEFRARHPAIKTSKGSINFRLSDKVPKAALQKVIRQAMNRR
ncbi:MAG TPA: DUF1801 domain-containing protein [Anaerolineales bacterium]|nr:DUF1801 domain-containing protein [Anaerolineales bacterium]